MLRKAILVVTGLLFLTSSAMANPVKIPGVGTGNGVLSEFFDGKVLLSVGAEYDNVFERELDENSKAEFYSFSGELALEYEKIIKGYVTLGQAKDITIETSLESESDKLNLKDNFIWGVGLTVKSSEFKIADLFADVSYRRMDDIGWESATISGTTYQLSNIASPDFTWEEWHVAVGVSKDIEAITPYAGIRYSDAKASFKATVDGDSYKGNVKSDKNFGVFVGTFISPIENLKINIQGRFIDETALTVSALFLF